MPTNKEVVAQIYEIMVRQDLEAQKAMFHEGAYWHVQAVGIPGAGRTVGADNIFNMVATEIFPQFEPGTAELKLIHLIGDDESPFVAAEHQLTATFINGTPYNNRYAFIWEVRDGKIAGVREYIDSYYVHSVTPPEFLEGLRDVPDEERLHG